MNKRGMLIVLSGPSGSGKGTIIKSLLQQREDTVLSISVTTRDPRPGEEDGISRKRKKRAADFSERPEKTCQSQLGTDRICLCGGAGHTVSGACGIFRNSARKTENRRFSESA